MDYNLLLTAQRRLLDAATKDLEKELHTEGNTPTFINFAWVHYCRQYKAFQEAVGKLTDQLLKEKKGDELITLKEDAAVISKNNLRLEWNVSQCIPLTNGALTAPGSMKVEDDQKQLKLPKRALPQFTGDVREWLGFWGEFKLIHEDKKLSVSDKFHCLINSTKEGSSARKLLQSFPFSPQNYDAAIVSLKERYGRENVLVKVYVRDLLQLVIEASTGKTLDFVDLVTSIISQIRNLETLNVTQDKCAQVLYPVVESCLPPDVLQAWQRSSSFREELEELIKFLQSEVNNHTERNLAHFNIGSGNGSGGGKSSKKGNGKGDVPTASSLMNGSSARGSNGGSGKNNNGERSCVFCDKPHSPLECKKALGMTLQQKREILKDKKHCYSCLWKFHGNRQCNVKTKCTICHRIHYAVMCPNLDLALNSGSSTPPPAPDPATVSEKAAMGTQPVADGKTTSSMANGVESREVPLQTLILTVHGMNGRSKLVRAVVDPGSQKSYVTSSLAQELELKLVGEESVVHQLFGGTKTELQKHKIVKVFVSDLEGQDNCNFNCSVSPQIACDIMSPPLGPWIDEFRKAGIVFSDLNSDSGNPIQLLIGNDVAVNVYTGRIHRLGYGPAAMETRWGWVLCGKIPVPEKHGASRSSMMVTNLLQFEGHPLAALWELETLGIREPVDTNEKEELARATQKHFDETVLQLTDGRYQVSLPWISGMREILPSNRFIAERRLKNVTRDLQVKGYLDKYNALFLQWEQDGMIEEVPTSEINNTGHYLPHRPVIKLSSTTTPIRPVFDGSSKAKGKPSVNDCLDKGPNLLELIPPILCGLRLKKIGVVADIKKAFQQISVAPVDRDCLRFLWWKDLACKQEKVYRHCRVVFGLTCSPYLLGATLHHHLEKTTGDKAAVVKKLLQSIYVDNAILSVDSLDEAEEFRKTTTSLLLPAKFDLRGWEFGPQENEKILPVLGLLWEMKSDTLSLDVSKATLKLQEKVTLRTVLSVVHSIFDPLGFASPFSILGKMLLRRCHDEKCGMDTAVSAELSDDVRKWAAQIPLLSEMKVPRHVCFGEQSQYSLHVMCDSSSLATAAAVFLRKEDVGKVKLFLLTGKSRVAPKKKATIPRLELVACVIASRLYSNTAKDIGASTLPVTFWCDSSTALAWIRGVGPWGVFVNNCVEKIRKLTSVCWWRHVPGKYNLADLPSRGCSARKLIESKWWEGPDWLRLPPHQWPITEEIPEVELVDAERKKTITVATVISCNHPIASFLRISDYPKILKCIAVWLALKRKLKEKIQQQTENKAKTGNSGPPYYGAEDIRDAERCLLLFVQQELHTNPARLKKLNVFRDETGLLRTRTRLTLEDDEGFQNPIVLPDKNKFVERLVRWEHSNNCHAGVTTLLSILREKFWILNGRRSVRGVLTKCWICRRFSSRPVVVQEAPLPRSRTELGIPFAVTGVDAAGPLVLKGGEKAWILLFTCANYRAVHLEVVDTLTADGFIRALRRFVCRRGRPRVIYSDNGRGFVAANKSFAQLNWNKVEEYATENRIDWRFNPPSAPWWGGWWERLIGLAKQLLRRILGNRVVHQWELETLACEVEDVMNNRPLTHLSENPEEPIPLTPNHFIRTAGSCYLPEADLQDATATRATYRKLQHLREQLRSRFRLEYLGLLRGHYSNRNSVELKKGDVVLIERENSKRVDWPLGVITEAVTGRDGKNRLFRLKMKNGELLRPAQRLYLMEQES